VESRQPMMRKVRRTVMTRSTTCLDENDSDDHVCGSRKISLDQTTMKSSITLRVVLAIGVCASNSSALAAQRGGRFSVVEASITDMRSALEQRRVTSRELVEQYLARIAMYEDRLHAVIAVNPRALSIADSLDRERAAGRIHGPLHGIPVAL